MIVADRAAAAAMLRTVRQSPVASHLEEIEWLRCMLPDSRPLIRLHIDALLESGQYTEAEALLSLALLQRPLDRSLSIRRVRVLMHSGRCDKAAREVDNLVRANPDDAATWRTAAEWALRAGRKAYALECASMALALRPNANHLTLFASAMRANGHSLKAARLIESDPRVGLAERAEFMESAGRIVDALDLVEASIERDPEAIAPRMHRVGLLERLGRRGRLSRLVCEELGRSPELDLRLSVSLLGLGRFTEGIRLAFRQRHEAGLWRRCMAVIAIGAMYAGRMRLAHRAAKKCEGLAFDHPEWYSLIWRRGLLGRVVQDQMDFLRAGRDPSRMLLPAVVADAVGVLRGRNMDHGELEAWRERFSSVETWLGDFEFTARARRAAA